MGSAKTLRKEFYWEQQRGICALQRTFECRQAGGQMTLKRSARRATWEHVTPRSDGGKNACNLVLACSQCNFDRGNSYPVHPCVAAMAEKIWYAWIASNKSSFKKIEATEPPLSPRALTLLGYDNEDGEARREMMRALHRASPSPSSKGQTE